MTWTSLGLCLLLIPLAASASTDDTAPYTSALSNYQGWSESTIRDWRETHRLVVDESPDHVGHGGMNMPANEAKPAAKDDTPASPKADPHGAMPHDGGH